MPSFRPPLHPRSTLPPPRRVGLLCPTPVGHGRGLASRPGCADPLPSSFTSFGCGSAKPLPALPLATGLAFTRFALAASRYLRRASLPLRAACVRSSSPGFTHARGTGETPNHFKVWIQILHDFVTCVSSDITKGKPYDEIRRE